MPAPDGVTHHAEVLQLGDGDDVTYVVTCTCHLVSPPHATRKAALRWARRHSPDVDAEVTVVSDDEIDQAGSGWTCMFCGATVEESPLRIHVHWTDDGVDGEQWYAAHRSCLVQRMSTEEWLTPLFARPPTPAADPPL